jgi:hypothetical protein
LVASAAAHTFGSAKRDTLLSLSPGTRPSEDGEACDLIWFSRPNHKGGRARGTAAQSQQSWCNAKSSRCLNRSASLPARHPVLSRLALLQEQQCGLGNHKFGEAAFQTDKYPIGYVDWSRVLQGAPQAVKAQREFSREVSLVFGRARFASHINLTVIRCLSLSPEYR